MAQALGGGIAKKYPEAKFIVSDPSSTAIDNFREAVSGRCTQAESNPAVFETAELVVLAIKPQYAADALSEIVKSQQNKPLVVSIMAGVPIEQLKKMVGSERIVRVMPNTPCLIGAGASAMAAGPDASDADLQQVSELLSCVGSVAQVPETMLDAVTGLSGSGPAYVFTFIEALIDGAVMMGMPRDTATDLAIQTVIGSAELVKQSGQHPAVLRDQVTSPGGTTIAALKSLQRNGFHDAVMSAVCAATERSRELGSG